MVRAAVGVGEGMGPPLDDLRRRATRLGFRTLNRVVLPVVKAGVASPPPIGVGLVVLETTGRVTGRPREVPLVATRLGSRIGVRTVRSDSQWVENLRSQPRAAVWLGGRKRPASSEVSDGPLTVASLAVEHG